MSTVRAKILVVDDEEDLRWLLTERLRREGFEVAAAGSGREALALVQQEAPDLIILDLVMPEMDGIQTLRQMREQGVTAKVVVLTAYGTAQQIREAMALGVREFIGKPFELDRLIRIVAEEAGANPAAGGQRWLLYVPIIHTMVDMGSGGEALKQEHLRRIGVDGWEWHRQVIEEIWDGIRARLLALELPWERVRIYQDGLPVSGKELEIAQDVAARGSKNYQIVTELVRRGARLMGTESPELLTREYTLVRRIAEAKTEGEREQARRKYAAEGAEILRDRDAFIARRIVETLAEGEVGLLFLGMMHEVDRLLPEGVQVKFLIDRLPLREAEAR